MNVQNPTTGTFIIKFIVRIGELKIMDADEALLVTSSVHCVVP